MEATKKGNDCAEQDKARWASSGTTSTGAVAWTEQYTPFGETILNPAANDNLDGYTGHIKDKATGLQPLPGPSSFKIDSLDQFFGFSNQLRSMQARYYDPALGRFLSIDPVGFSPDMPFMFGRYTYVGNDPINAWDPFGLQSCSNGTKCPDIMPLPPKKALKVADAAAKSQKSGKEGGSSMYRNRETGEERIVAGDDAGSCKENSFRHKIGNRDENEDVVALGHTHLDKGQGQGGLARYKGRRDQNAPSEADQAAMDKVNAPIITVGPDVTSQLYRVDGQDRVQILKGSEKKMPNLKRQRIKKCTGETQC